MKSYTALMHEIVDELTGPGSPPVPKHQKEIMRKAADIAGGALDNIGRIAFALESIAEAHKPKLAMDRPNDEAAS